MSSPSIRRRIVLVTSGALCIGSLLATRVAVAADDVAGAIAKVMNASVAAWSAGDLNTFMDSYEDSPDTLFVGSTGLVRGKAAIAARYAKQFGQGGPGRLGKLSFETLEIRPTGEHYALMIGRFHLQPVDRTKAEASGLFSLVFHERDGRWRIVCDHTS